MFKTLFILIPTNNLMFTFQISLAHSMLHNDFVGILIIIVNRQIISWSINHYRNRLFFSIFNFSSRSRNGKKKSTWAQHKFNLRKKLTIMNILVSIFWMTQKVKSLLSWKKNFEWLDGKIKLFSKFHRLIEDRKYEWKFKNEMFKIYFVLVVKISLFLLHIFWTF